MNRKVIYFDRRRSSVRLLMITGILLVAGVLSCIFSPTDMSFSTVLSGLLFGGAFVLPVIQIIRRPKTALELDSEGFRFNASSEGKKTGKINWHYVQSIETGTANGKKQIVVKFTDPKSTLRDTRLAIHARELNINFYEMERLVLYFYHRHHESRTIVDQN